MASQLAPTSRRKMSGAIRQSGCEVLGTANGLPTILGVRGKAVHPRPALVASTEAVSVWSCGERGSPAGPKCGWFRGKLILSPSMASEDSTTQISILPGRQSRMSNANVIQVRQKVTNFKTFPQVKVKDEKKKLGECKAEFQPRTVRGCASRGTVQNMKKSSPSSQSSQLSAESQHLGGRQEAQDHRRGRQERSLQHH